MRWEEEELLCSNDNNTKKTLQKSVCRRRLSPPSLIKIGLKLPKFLGVVSGWAGRPKGGWGGLNMGQTLYVFLFSCIPPKVTFMQNFIDME